MLTNKKSFSKKNISNQLTINAHQINTDILDTPLITQIETDLTIAESNISTNTSNISSNLTKINTNTANIASNLTKINTNTTNIASNLTKINTNTSNISSNLTKINTNISNITSLQGRMTTAESNVSNLQGRMTTAESNISNIQIGNNTRDLKIAILQDNTQFITSSTKTNLSSDLTLPSSGEISSVGNLFISSNNTGQIEVRTGGRVSTTQLTPITNNNYTLGSSTLRWSTVYATNGTINTSDIRQKKNISYVGNDWIHFIENLNPVLFNWNWDDDSDIKTIGLIAQDVKNELPIKTTLLDDSDENMLGINYSQFIPLLINYVQHLNRRIEYLEKRNCL